MFGTSNSNLFSKAMAIEEDGSKTDITSFIKSNQVKDTGTSDGDRDKTSFIKSNQVKDKSNSSDDEDKSKSLAATKSSDDEDKSKSSDDEDKSKSLAATKSSDSTDNSKGQQVQRVSGVPELQCDECVEYWALAIKFLTEEQGLTVSEAFKQFAAYFIATLPDSLSSQEKTTAVDLMECVKDRAISLLAIEQPQQQSIQQQNLTTQKQMQQQQQFEKLQLMPLAGQQNQMIEPQKTELLPLPVQPTQKSESQPQQMTQQSKPVVKETSQPVQPTQESESQPQQMTQQSQQENNGLSIITQEDMQKQQYENFKKLHESVKQKYHSIEILK